MILPFSKIGKNDAPKAGGKGASLGEMTQAGIPVPPGFVVLAETFEAFLDTNSLRSEIKQILGNIDHNSVTSIESASEKIQELILNGEIPSEIKKEIQKYQETLDTPFVAVRSSATAEDGAEHAWAGQLDTYLNVAKGDVEKKIQSCWASLFTPRALFYRSEKGLGELHISVAVVVQSMVDAESAGVAFSVHPVTENYDEIVIEGSWGLGEAVVSGEVTPDSFVVSKSSKENLSQHIAEKKKGIFRNIDGLNEWRQIPEQEREKPVLTKKALNELSELVIHIENHYGFPCDIEWAYAEGKIYILQARPITTLEKVENGEAKNNPYEKINEDSYDFLWTVGFPYIYCSMFLESGYKEIDTVSFNKGNSYTQFIGKKDRALLSEKGLELYLTGYEKYEKRIKSKRDYLEKSLEHLEEIKLHKINNGDLRKLFHEVVRIFIEIWTDYFVTEYHHTDKIGDILKNKEESRDKEVLQKNVEKMGHFKLYQREFINKFMYEPSLIDKYLREIKSRYNLKYEIEWYSYTEILDILENKEIDVPDRKNGVIRGKFSNWQEIIGEEANNIYKQLENIDKNTSIIKGKTGNKGRYIGNVKKIAFSVETDFTKEIEHMTQGQILVSGSTGPEMILACKKAGAIITDEGGIISHAAIISRELHIPSIIGTKIATKILEDGDLVEVDADNGVVKILEKKREIQWGFTYDRQMSYQRIDLFHHGYCPRLSEFFDVTLENELYRIQDGIVSVFYDGVGHKQAFDKISALLGGEKKTQWYKKIYNTITKDYREFISFLDQGEKKKNIPDIQKALTKHMEHNRKISLSTWLLYSYLEEILSDAVKIMLEKKGIKDWQRIFEILGQPDEMIPSDRWEYNIAEAVLADNEKQEKIVKKLCLKYRSYGMYDVMFNGKSEGDIQEKISSTSKNDAQKTIKNLQEKYSKQKTRLKKIRKISWSESESSLIQLYRLYANFKDWKNFHRERSSYQIREIYQGIAKKYKQKQENLSYMTKDEILDGIEQKKWVNEDEIQKRKENSALIFIGKSIKNVHSTQKLEELDKKLFIEQNTISGTTAFPGNISGTARIINSHDDLRKLKKGDIMISSTTRPDYLPFIADIAGFVTNEGGTLSHAAILAREIKKPCIIGTKIATQVIKSGDEITLDGENGVVRILN
ncbi:hypothetical protein KA057_00505 [Candidatus Gracilibacteria bacterium]|nr:hypothetical protein [Candidatus Gracilibacteria bacterium]